MPHPSLGFPPPDVQAGQPAAAAHLRANAERIGRVAIQAADKHAPGFGERYDDNMLRLLLRDYERHIEQLARAIETGDDGFVTNYGEWLIPIYRRRNIPMRDFMALLGGLRDAAGGVLTPDENQVDSFDKTRGELPCSTNSRRLFQSWHVCCWH